jgi:hypothetical protein
VPGDSCPASCGVYGEPALVSITFLKLVKKKRGSRPLMPGRLPLFKTPDAWGFWGKGSRRGCCSPRSAA